MSRFPLYQVDAFTVQPLHGNPCAVVFDADSLSDAQMQAIAREMNLSETAFVLRSTVADFRARYFTPAQEIPMAGHPTVATVHALVETSKIQLTGPKTTISLELQVGPIPVEIQADESGQVEQIVMTQDKPQFLGIHAPQEVLPAFGLAVDDVLADVPIQTVSTGTP